MISNLRAFEIYLALTSHFREGSSYDFFKYQGKMASVKEKTFQGRKDKFIFERFARKSSTEQHAIEYIVANQFKGNTYIRNMSEAHLIWWTYQKDSMYYLFEKELQQKAQFQNAIGGNEEAQIHLMLYNIAVNGAMFKAYDESPKHNNILWESTKERLVKFSPFIKHYWNPDTQKLREIIKDSMTK